jgi:hypothetical protein
MCNFQTTQYSYGHSKPYTAQTLCDQQQESYGKCAKEMHKHVDASCGKCQRESQWQKVDGEEEWREDLDGAGEKVGWKRKVKQREEPGFRVVKMAAEGILGGVWEVAASLG